MRPSPFNLATLAAAGLLSLGAAPAPAADAVSFELNSWGRLLSSWTLNADGSGERVTARQAKGATFGDVDRDLQKLGPDPARYRRLLEALRPARAYAGREVPCGPRMTDLPYGELTWRHAGAARSIRFDSGCSSSTARKVLASVHAADELMAKWAADAPKVEIPRPPSPPAPPR
jgi:hypothetical protein